MKDYGYLRGFNYTQSSVWTDTDFWEKYDHAVVDREMGYAERLELNSARIFLTYSSYAKDPGGFLANVKDFVRTAWEHGITSTPIIYHGFRFLDEDNEPVERKENRLMPLPRTILEPDCWVRGEKYFDDLLGEIGDEPGLLFWDISNEPGYHDDWVTWYDGEPEYHHASRNKPDMDALRSNQEKVWEIVRHFCRYVKARDPRHDIGVGNTFIYELEPSRTIDLVDLILFHDYSSTRERMRRIYDMAKDLGKKYGKPVINNETCCLCRANPYDMTLEMLGKYGFGWYLFELMIGNDAWNRVHGIVYPDGTVRDPSIVAALFGFFRNRGETAVKPDVNQENRVLDLIKRTEALMTAARRPNRNDPGGNIGEALELCEYAANLLEAGELIPMANLPTAKAAAFRRQACPDPEEIMDWLYDLVVRLKEACRIV